MAAEFVAIGAFSAMIGVALGAFGAHALRQRLTPERQVTFETGARYQIYHALALLSVGILLGRAGTDQAWLSAAGWLFAAGTVLFSGSLYALALSGTRALGAVTPVGGLAFIAGWGSLMIGILRG